MQLGTGFWASRAFLSAVELGVFRELAKKPADLATLRTRLSLHERSARDFFDTLVALGVIDRGEDGIYRNTPASDLYLDPAKPSYIGGIFEMAAGRLYAAWAGLTDALRTGRPQNEARDSDDTFAALYADPERLELFLRAMAGISRPTAQAVATAFPWQDVHSFADIGCAAGGFPVEIVRIHPHLVATGFDLPPVRPVFERYVREHGVADRLTFQAGSFFDDPLPSADVLVMGHILHDWDLPTKKSLLAKAHAALPPGGTLLVYDAMIDDARRENAFGLLMSLNMLVETPGGFDYTGADCIGWMREAGFREARVERLPGPYAMAVAIK
jgi:SAM-dependent methyltransferase